LPPSVPLRWFWLQRQVTVLPRYHGDFLYLSFFWFNIASNFFSPFGPETARFDKVPLSAQPPKPLPSLSLRVFLLSTGCPGSKTGFYRQWPCTSDRSSVTNGYPIFFHSFGLRTVSLSGLWVSRLLQCPAFCLFVMTPTTWFCFVPPVSACRYPPPLLPSFFHRSPFFAGFLLVPVVIALCFIFWHQGRVPSSFCPLSHNYGFSSLSVRGTLCAFSPTVPLWTFFPGPKRDVRVCGLPTQVPSAFFLVHTTYMVGP